MRANTKWPWPLLALLGPLFSLSLFFFSPLPCLLHLPSFLILSERLVSHSCRSFVFIFLRSGHRECVWSCVCVIQLLHIASPWLRAFNFHGNRPEAWIDNDFSWAPTHIFNNVCSSELKTRKHRAREQTSIYPFALICVQIINRVAANVGCLQFVDYFLNEFTHCSVNKTAENVIEDWRNRKISTFKKLISENFVNIS